LSTLFIAEVSSNHHQSIDRCYEFIDSAAKIGCQAVKFQLFRIDQLFTQAVILSNTDIQGRVKWELPLDFVPLIAERCKKNRILFGCTPFYIEAVNYLSPYVDFFKIASYELLWLNLISACSQTKKPLILSSGMANINEIKAAIKVATNNNCKELSLLHCVSGYPTPLEQCNLKAISTLKSLDENIKIGWSDHSKNPDVLNRAINHWNAELVEFHLDLDGEGGEYKSGHCWLPNEIEPIIKSTKKFELIDGNGIKEPLLVEGNERFWRADPSDGLRPLKSIRN
tara:strand:+ start:9506 stop:10354 length:849 start_codon:yes stop_codon:yes gene_type:complete